MSPRCLDNGLVTGMFTHLVCIRGNIIYNHKIGVPGTDTAEQKKRKQQANRSFAWLGVRGNVSGGKHKKQTTEKPPKDKRDRAVVDAVGPMHNTQHKKRSSEHGKRD